MYDAAPVVRKWRAQPGQAQYLSTAGGCFRAKLSRQDSLISGAPFMGKQGETFFYLECQKHLGTEPYTERTFSQIFEQEMEKEPWQYQKALCPGKVLLEIPGHHQTLSPRRRILVQQAGCQQITYFSSHVPMKSSYHSTLLHQTTASTQSTEWMQSPGGSMKHSLTTTPDINKDREKQVWSSICSQNTWLKTSSFSQLDSQLKTAKFYKGHERVIQHWWLWVESMTQLSPLSAISQITQTFHKLSEGR